MEARSERMSAYLHTGMRFYSFETKTIHVSVGSGGGVHLHLQLEGVLLDGQPITSMYPLRAESENAVRAAVGQAVATPRMAGRDEVRTAARA